MFDRSVRRSSSRLIDRDDVDVVVELGVVPLVVVAAAGRLRFKFCRSFVSASFASFGSTSRAAKFSWRRLLRLPDSCLYSLKEKPVPAGMASTRPYSVAIHQCRLAV